MPASWLAPVRDMLAEVLAKAEDSTLPTPTLWSSPTGRPSGARSCSTRWTTARRGGVLGAVTGDSGWNGKGAERAELRARNPEGFWGVAGAWRQVRDPAVRAKKTDRATRGFLPPGQELRHAVDCIWLRPTKGPGAQDLNTSARPAAGHG